jgi:hypothetical protein
MILRSDDGPARIDEAVWQAEGQVVRTCLWPQVTGRRLVSFGYATTLTNGASVIGACSHAGPVSHAALRLPLRLRGPHDLEHSHLVQQMLAIPPHSGSTGCIPARPDQCPGPRPWLGSTR